MKVEWIIITDSGVSHAFPEDGRTLQESRSLCGLRPSRQLVLPFNLPKPSKDSHCVRCSRSVEKREEEKAA